ncbi:hypothetical protein [Sinomonas mesophila]|uniref:hypothetical protein n=1 Tax=Sinomonas mesophila TaxID=1531955 RepID=UPI0009866FF6|nr:hypothetical protein [Sinomonas mesophila]
MSATHAHPEHEPEREAARRGPREEPEAYEDRTGAQEQGPEPGKPIPRNAEDDDAPGRADVTPASQGLGAMYGDAGRTPHPGPVRPPGPVDQAAMDAVAEEYEVGSTDDGERYLTPRDEDTEAPRTTDDFPDRSPGA